MQHMNANIAGENQGVEERTKEEEEINNSSELSKEIDNNDEPRNESGVVLRKL